MSHSGGPGMSESQLHDMLVDLLREEEIRQNARGRWMQNQRAKAYLTDVHMQDFAHIESTGARGPLNLVDYDLLHIVSGTERHSYASIDDPISMATEVQGYKYPSRQDKLNLLLTCIWYRWCQWVNFVFDVLYPRPQDSLQTIGYELGELVNEDGDHWDPDTYYAMLHHPYLRQLPTPRQHTIMLVVTLENRMLDILRAILIHCPIRVRITPLRCNEGSVMYLPGKFELWHAHESNIIILDLFFHVPSRLEAPHKLTAYVHLKDTSVCTCHSQRGWHTYSVPMTEYNVMNISDYRHPPRNKDPTRRHDNDWKFVCQRFNELLAELSDPVKKDRFRARLTDCPADWTIVRDLHAYLAYYLEPRNTKGTAWTWHAGRLLKEIDPITYRGKSAKRLTAKVKRQYSRQQMQHSLRHIDYYVEHKARYRSLMHSAFGLIWTCIVLNRSEDVRNMPASRPHSLVALAREVVRTEVLGLDKLDRRALSSDDEYRGLLQGCVDVDSQQERFPLADKEPQVLRRLWERPNSRVPDTIKPLLNPKISIASTRYWNYCEWKELMDEDCEQGCLKSGVGWCCVGCTDFLLECRSWSRGKLITYLEPNVSYLVHKGNISAPVV